MKLALITGGSRGLGAALVHLYADQGWTVKEFSRSGATDHHIDCDFSDPVQSTSLLQTVFRQLQEQPWTDIVLINNVGVISPMGPIHLTEPQHWQTHFHINLESCVTAVGLFLQTFTNPKANRYIANISSGVVRRPYFGLSLYCASKAAMEAFTNCVALEQSETPHPVHVFIVDPGPIDTDMQDVIRSQPKDRFAEVDRFRALKAEEKLPAPRKIATAILSIIESSPKGGERYDARDYFS